MPQIQKANKNESNFRVWCKAHQSQWQGIHWIQKALDQSHGEIQNGIRKVYD